MTPKFTSIIAIGSFIDNLFNIDENDKEESIDRNIGMILNDLRSSLRSNIDTMSVQELIGLYGLTANFLDRYNIGSQRVVLITNKIMEYVMRETEWLSKSNSSNASNSQLVYVMRNWNLYYNIFKNTQDIIDRKIENSDNRDEIKLYDGSRTEVYPIIDPIELAKYGTKISNTGLDLQQPVLPPPSQYAAPRPVRQIQQVKPAPPPTVVNKKSIEPLKPQTPKPNLKPEVRVISKPSPTPISNIDKKSLEPPINKSQAIIEQSNIIEDELDDIPTTTVNKSTSPNNEPPPKIETISVFQSSQEIEKLKEISSTTEIQPVEDIKPVEENAVQNVEAKPVEEPKKLTEEPKKPLAAKTSKVKTPRGRPPKSAAPKTEEISVAVEVPIEKPIEKSISAPTKLKFNSDELSSDQQIEEIL